MSEPVCRAISTPSEWAHATAIRFQVFVEEQRVPFDEELDEHDREAFHLLALVDGRPVGTGRLVQADQSGRIGRMAVLPEARSSGVGSALLRGLMAEAERRNLRTVHLAAQLQARAFYARHGFVASGPHFLDAGIWHQRMEVGILGDTPKPPP